MRDLHKNPIFYYILVPVVVALWPLLVAGVYLPRAHRRCQELASQCKQAEAIMLEILRLDPERAADANEANADFSYAAAVNKAAAVCNIPASKYKLNSGLVIKVGQQKTQTATVSLKEVNVESFAKFLSTIQLRWPNLQCIRVKLTAKQGLPDLWDVDIDFRYYY